MQYNIKKKFKNHLILCILLNNMTLILYSQIPELKNMNDFTCKKIYVSYY